MKTTRPLVGVSQCLLGDAMRYDGKSKANIIVVKKLSKLFELLPVCSEVEAGLAVPRPPVQLSEDIDNPKLTGRDDPTIDITELMQSYCESKPTQLKMLSGFIFKSRSPSCGLNSTPVFINNHSVVENSRGLFARALCETYPELPVIEDSTLENPQILRSFINAVSVKF